MSSENLPLAGKRHVKTNGWLPRLLHRQPAPAVPLAAPETEPVVSDEVIDFMTLTAEQQAGHIQNYARQLMTRIPAKAKDKRYQGYGTNKQTFYLSPSVYMDSAHYFPLEGGGALERDIYATQVRLVQEQSADVDRGAIPEFRISNKLYGVGKATMPSEGLCSISLNESLEARTPEERANIMATLGLIEKTTRLHLGDDSLPPAPQTVILR